MWDDSEIGIQDGARGRGAKERTVKKAKEREALAQIVREEKANAVKAAKRGKPGPDAPTQVPKTQENSGFRNVRLVDQQKLLTPDPI